MDSHRHPEHDVARAGTDPPDITQGTAHRGRRRAGAQNVIVAGEPQEHRVTAELQQRSAAGGGVGEQRREACVDRVD